MAGKTGAAAKTTARGTTPAKAAVKKAAPKKTAGSKALDLPVLAGEDAWTAAELAEVRGELEADRERLQGEVDEAEADLAELMRDSGEGSGDDQADAGAATWEREHELSLANNAKELLEQIVHALERIEEGSYGACESCGNPIGKMRLQAFPRATLCLTCKQKQERR
ncbi:TraR/DksA family transcriptional regulator [Ornithinimicrobium faecis]|uniref:TraR/DksA family transcriptional regulator n=1 Tax=Ornithinimicrobium faecis TaxID=2934158 RepID=UPI0021185A8D|nr:TraR/DksA C4-type zinc finger protein [Ornithinimicrobium sp. HY1745]